MMNLLFKHLSYRETEERRRKMKKLFIVLLVFTSLCFFSTNSHSWVEDFSSDPGWTTNKSSNYYWDPSDETYYAKQVNVNYGGYYSYYDVGHDGSSFHIEYDIKIISNNYASDISFGIFDTDMDTNNYCCFIRLLHTREDRGRTTILVWHDLNGSGYREEINNQFSYNTWYQVVMDYDSNANTLNVDITERDTGVQFASFNAIGVGPFSSDMGRIGISNLRDSHYQVPRSIFSG
jgi:hypothetical protein